MRAEDYLDKGDCENELKQVTRPTEPWFNFISNVSWCIGELSSGNGRTWDPRNADFTNFAITGEHGTLTQAWESLYAVVAQANSVINTMPEFVHPDISQDVVNNAIGEARFIRATAYFYLVRILFDLASSN